MARLNSDELDDIVVGTFGGEVFAIRSLGGSRFDEPRQIASGIASAAIVSLQLDGDGLSDLILNDYHNPRLVLLRSQGEGVFVQSEIELPGPARSLSTGQLASGATALVAAARELNSVWILAPSTDGSFAVEETVSIERPINAALVAGGRALVVAARNGLHSFELGTGVWEATGRRYWLGGNLPELVSIVERGGETRILLVDRFHGEFATVTISSDGTMGPPTVWAGVPTMAGLLIDTNEDGLDDVVLASDNGGPLVILRALEEGRYGVRSGVSVGEQPLAGVLVESAELGPLALVIRERAGDVVAVALGGSSEVTKIATTGDAPGAIALLSDPDQPKVRFAVSHRFGEVAKEVKIFEWETGAPSATEIASLRLGSHVYALAGADLDGDGRMDLAAAFAGGNGLAVAFAGEDATWDVQRYDSVSGAAVAPMPCGQETCLALGSFTSGGVTINRFEARKHERLAHLPVSSVLGLAAGDGGLAVASYSPGSLLFSPDPLGGESLQKIAPLSSARSVAMIDLNRDGAKDLAVLGEGGTKALITFAGNDWSERLEVTGLGRPFHLIASDINHDGVGDIVVFNQRDGLVNTVLGRCRQPMP